MSLDYTQRALLRLLGNAPNDTHKTATMRAFVLMIEGGTHGSFTEAVCFLRGAGLIAVSPSGRSHRITSQGYDVLCRIGVAPC